MPWEIVIKPEAAAWYRSLSDRDAQRVAASLDQLASRGPGTGRPYVDSITGSRHHNMKELRSAGGHLRALFAFDRQRRAVVLLGGDKSGDWRGWYLTNIPRANRFYDQHLRENPRGGDRWPLTRAGDRSAGRDR
jgi:hypothetical protein